MTPTQLANKPASEASFLEKTAAGVLKGSVVGDGDIAPSQHADYAIRVAWALITKLAAQSDKGGAA